MGEVEAYFQDLQEALLFWGRIIYIVIMPDPLLIAATISANPASYLYK
jgi:hypothetical protein